MMLMFRLIASSMRQTLAVVLLALLCAFAGQAQPEAEGDSAKEAARQQAVARLNDIQTLLAAKRRQLDEVQQEFEQASADQQPALQEQLDTLKKELSDLQQTFEQIAIDGVDQEVFNAQPEQFDWRNELVQVTRPLLENLKSLTEKPRKIERLRSEIEQNEKRLEVAQQAETALAALQDQPLSADARANLTALVDQWQQRRAEFENQLEVARYQLANLLGQNISWWETLGEAAADFLHERGLTLVLAIAVAVLALLLLRGLRWLQEKRLAGAAPRQRTLRRRLLAYVYRVFTLLLVVVAVLTVFYVRGDLLLLALSLVVLGFMLLSFRQVLPRYITELKLLLNIGPVREGERLIYNGLPWEVKSINVYSVLRNPDLEGVIRLQLGSLVDMHSRPCGAEPWFPSRAGDFVLLPDDQLGEVLRQTPEVVQLRMLGGDIKEYSAAQFAQLAVRNLSRGDTFAIPVTFGIDYRHQSICLDEVPRAFHQALQEAMQRNGFGDNVQSILVEFKTAATSSLDYLVAVMMKSPAAASYYIIERLIQRTCVEVCNREGWNIPFTQLTIHPSDNMQLSALAPVQPVTSASGGQ